MEKIIFRTISDLFSDNKFDKNSRIVLSKYKNQTYNICDLLDLKHHCSEESYILEFEGVNYFIGSISIGCSDQSLYIQSRIKNEVINYIIDYMEDDFAEHSLVSFVLKDKKIIEGKVDYAYRKLSNLEAYYEFQ